MAWGGAPGNRTTNASNVGLWSPRWFESLVRGLGFGDPSTAPNETIGILPGSLTGYPDDWALYQAGEVTKGGENPVPGISFYYPLSGATMEDIAFSISWSPVRNATGYQFQMATNSDLHITCGEQNAPRSRFYSGNDRWRKGLIIGGSASFLAGLRESLVKWRPDQKLYPPHFLGRRRWTSRRPQPQEVHYPSYCLAIAAQGFHHALPGRMPM